MMDFTGRTWIPYSQSHQSQNPCYWEEFSSVNGQKTFGNTRTGPSQKNVAMGLSIYWEKAFYVIIFKLNGSDG